MAAFDKTRGISLATSLTVVLLCLAGFAFGVNAQGKSSPPSIPVTSTVYDYDSTDTTRLLLRSDDLAPLNIAPTVNQGTYSDTDPNVTSQMYDPNGWRLDLTNQTARRVYLTFSSYVSGSTQPPKDSLYNARLISVCYDATNHISGFLQIVPGTSNNRCSLRVEIPGPTNSGIGYVFVMSPVYSGTGWATVACSAGNVSGACVSWTIIPNTTSPANLGNNATVANLYQVQNGGKTTWVGSYHNTYRIDVTNP